MSIYSGFANRQLETNYNKLLENIIKILSNRLIRFYENISVDENNFFKKLNKNICLIAIMEKNKYLFPKFSECLADLCIYFKIEIPKNENI